MSGSAEDDDADLRIVDIGLETLARARGIESRIHSLRARLEKEAGPPAERNDMNAIPFPIDGDAGLPAGRPLILPRLSRRALLLNLAGAAAVLFAVVLVERNDRDGDQDAGRPAPPQSADRSGAIGDPIPVVKNRADVEKLQPRLLALRAEGDQIDDAVLAAIVESQPSLDRLEIDWARITDGGLAALAGLRSLYVLAATRCGAITDAGIAPLASLPHLESLDLTGYVGQVAMGPDDKEYFDPFSKVKNGVIDHVIRMPKLVSLNLHGTRVDDEGIALLASRAPAGLRRLDLGHSGVTAGSIPLLLRIERLESLALEGHPWLKDEDLAVLARHEGLRELSVAGHGFTSAKFGDDGIAAIVAAGRIERFGAGHCAVTKAGWMSVGSLKPLRSIEVVSPKGFDDDCLARLAGRRLELLKILWCQSISAAGLDAMNPDDIGRIDLRATSIPESAVKAFAARGHGTSYVDERGQIVRPDRLPRK